MKVLPCPGCGRRITRPRHDDPAGPCGSCQAKSVAVAAGVVRVDKPPPKRKKKPHPRTAEIVKMRSRGMSYEQIGSWYGISRSYACRLVMRALRMSDEDEADDDGPTMEELDALIAERMKCLPKWFRAESEPAVPAPMTRLGRAAEMIPTKSYRILR